MENLQKLDAQIYTFVINTVGFLKTLEKEGVKNSATMSLAKITKTFNTEFNNFYEKRANQQEIKNVLSALLDDIKFILIENFFL